MYTVYLDNKLLYSSRNLLAMDSYKIFDPKLSLELGKSGQFTFTVPPTNALYGKFKLLKTVLTIYHNDDVLWKGRVLNAEKDFYGQRTITCEGIMGYLNDSIYKPNTVTTDLFSIFQSIIDNHNAQVEPTKRFTIGAFTMPNRTIEYNGTYQKSMSLLSDLANDYGGFFSVSYDETCNLINWFEDVTETADQVIRFGENLLDITDQVAGEDVITCVIPTGKDDLKLSEEYIESEIGCDLYGHIWDRFEYSDITDPEELRTTAQKDLNDSIWSTMVIDIRGADLSLLGYDVDAIVVGKKYRCIAPSHNMDYRFPCSKMELDLQNPENNTYTLGAQTIWTQIDDVKDYEDLIRDNGKIKMINDKSLTARGSKTEAAVSTKTGRYTGTVQFSDNTNLRFENGILVGGTSSEGDF